MRYVIIGNSAAAIGCVEGIRQVDQEGPITIISREKYHTYSRPLISYLLAGKTDGERMKYRADDFYEKNGCEVMLGRTAVAIDSLAKTVLLDNGCLLYTSSVPILVLLKMGASSCCAGATSLCSVFARIPNFHSS